LQQFSIHVQGLDDAENRCGGEHEHHGEARDEQTGRTGHSDPTRTCRSPIHRNRCATKAFGLRSGGGRRFGADQPGQIGQVTRYQRHYTRRSERDQSGQYARTERQ
jgi:hypothetical protein